MYTFVLIDYNSQGLHYKFAKILSLEDMPYKAFSHPMILRGEESRFLSYIYIHIFSALSLLLNTASIIQKCQSGSSIRYVCLRPDYQYFSRNMDTVEFAIPNLVEMFVFTLIYLFSFMPDKLGVFSHYMFPNT